jgi:hypothetical protein
MQDDLLTICVHEIGHAMIFEALGVHVIMITVGPLSGGKCYYDPCSRGYNKSVNYIANRAGYYFERIFLRNMTELEGDFYERISPKVNEEDFCEWLCLKNMKIREVDVSGFCYDYDELPEPRSVEDELQLNTLLQICRQLNFKAVRAVLDKLYDTPIRQGNKVMSGRRLRKIIQNNGGLYAR